MPSAPESQDFPYEVSAWLGQVLKTDIIISSMMLFHTNTIYSFGFRLRKEHTVVWGPRRVCDYKDHSLTPFNFFFLYNFPEQIYNGFLAVCQETWCPLSSPGIASENFQDELKSGKKRSG